MPETCPDVTIYVVRDEASGKLEPIATSIAGVSLPVLRAAFIADPNGRSTGTRALCAELLFPVGGAEVLEVGGPEDVPRLS